MIWNIIGIVVFGGIIGAIARFFMKGHQPINVLETIVCGIAGALIGYWIASLFGVEHTHGIDWIRDTISVVAAILIITIYCAIRGRGKSQNI